MHRHFVEHNHPLAVETMGSACFYRWNYEPESMRRCALGVFIPNAKYSEELEGQNITLICTEYLDFSWIEGFGEWEIHEQDVAWLANLQKVHDRTRNTLDKREFKTRLEGFALGTGISYTGWPELKE